MFYSLGYSSYVDVFVFVRPKTANPKRSLIFISELLSTIVPDL